MAAVDYTLLENFLIIQMPRQVTQDFGASLLAKIKETDGVAGIKLDFNGTVNIDSNFYPQMHLVKKCIEAKQLSLASINLKPQVKEQLSASGTGGFFRSRLQTVKTFRPKTPALDVNFIQPFVDATVSVLKVQAHTDVKIQKIVLKSKNQPHKLDIAGVIPIGSDDFKGTIALCFEERPFLNVCEKIFGEKMDTIDEDVEDSAGELLNMIYGIAKAYLTNEKGYKFQKTIPTIVRGENIRIKQFHGPTFILPFTSDIGDFHMEIELFTQTKD